MRWSIHTQNLITYGQVGEVMVLMREGERIGSDVEFVAPLTFVKPEASGAFDFNGATFRAHRGGFGERNEIDDLLQAMMDAAWDRGLRPTKMDHNEREVKAIERHLEDMRRLAGIGAQKPETGG